MLSPLGEGLYRNGIAQSGNALSRLLEARRRGVTEAEAKRYLGHTECDLGGETEVVTCLQGKTVAKLFDNPVAEGDPARDGQNGLAPFRYVMYVPLTESRNPSICDIAISTSHAAPTP